MKRKYVAGGSIYGLWYSKIIPAMRRLPCPGIVSTPDVKLTDDEQKHLFALIHKGQHSARVITRARILFKLDKGHCHQEIYSALEVSLPTVLKIHKRFAEGGLEAAISELPRPGLAPTSSTPSRLP